MTPEAATSVRPPASRAKRLLRIAAAGLAVVLAVEVGFFLWRIGDADGQTKDASPRLRTMRINMESFSRIREGMCEKEVAFILGGPAGDYRTPPTHGHWYPDRPKEFGDGFGNLAYEYRRAPERFAVQFWESDTACICVEFTRPEDASLPVVKSKRCWPGKTRQW